MNKQIYILSVCKQNFKYSITLHRSIRCIEIHLSFHTKHALLVELNMQMRENIQYVCWSDCVVFHSEISSWIEFNIY